MRNKSIQFHYTSSRVWRLTPPSLLEYWTLICNGIINVSKTKANERGEKKEGETISRQKQHCRFVSDLWLATRARTCTYICGYSICHHLLRKRITSKSCSAPLPPKIKVGQKKTSSRQILLVFSMQLAPTSLLINRTLCVQFHLSDCGILIGRGEGSCWRRREGRGGGGGGKVAANR